MEINLSSPQSFDLIGDSILDNKAYVDDGNSVSDKLRRLTAKPVRLLAKDGHTSQGALGQIPESVEAGTAAVLSVGGNDALHSSFVLSEDSEKVCHALKKLSPFVLGFQSRYRLVLDRLMEVYAPSLIRICTIYNKMPLERLPADLLPVAEEVLLAIRFFNDVITEEASRRKLEVIDLRIVCEDPRCYSQVSVIEPSEFGGERIAEAILGAYA